MVVVVVVDTECRIATMLKLLIVAVLTAGSSAWVAPKGVVSRPSTRLHESFGFGFAEDTYTNQPVEIGGEAEYKQWVNTVREDNMLNRKVRCSKPMFWIICRFWAKNNGRDVANLSIACLTLFFYSTTSFDACVNWNS